MSDPAARWRQQEALLDAALDLAPARRVAFVRDACAGDAALRDEVLHWLRSCERADGFLDESAAAFAAPLVAEDAAGPPLPERIGPYRVLREAGHGGMGAVYLAERDDDHFRQQVALKLVRGGLHSTYLVRRFREERQILASLEHPHIARLLDGGVTDDGLPYFAMEFVAGTPADRFCDARRLDVAARLALFLDVCGAVQYAHRNLVVHRDLKPSNLLVTDAGEPKLLDFGIAKLLSAEADAEAGLTQTGVRLLTPEFASPEQLRGEAVSTASDVYALGVLLYLLLAGRLPHARGAGSVRELEERVLTRDPERPSVAVARAEDPEAVAAARSTTPARLARRLRGDLDTVALKAMHRDPARRYDSAEALAVDLRRHLDGLPVAARPDTAAYRARKFVQRHRWGVSAAATVALLLVGFSTVTAVQAARIREGSVQIAAERDRAQQGEAFLLGLFERADPYEATAAAPTVREVLDRGVDELGREAMAPETRASLFLAIGRAYTGIGETDRAIALIDSSYTLLRRLHGVTDPETVSVANQLANVLRVGGRYEDATALYRQILAVRRRTQGDDAPDVARSRNGLALVLLMQGRSAEAEAQLRAALATDRRNAAAEPAHLAQTLNNLGRVLQDRRDFAAAEAAHRESLARRRAIWGADHFEATVAMSNLASVLVDRGAYVEADSLFRAVLDLRRRLVGEDHIDLASDRAGYALLLHRQGRLAESDALYRQALAVQRRALPPGHHQTATTEARLGLLLLDRGRPAEARPLLEAALAARRRFLVPTHAQVTDLERALAASGAAR